jgi:hypothetical protein
LRLRVWCRRLWRWGLLWLCWGFRRRCLLGFGRRLRLRLGLRRRGLRLRLRFGWAWRGGLGRRKRIQGCVEARLGSGHVAAARLSFLKGGLGRGDLGLGGSDAAGLSDDDRRRGRGVFGNSANETGKENAKGHAGQQREPMGADHF